MKSFNQFLTICEAIYDRDKKSDVDLEVGKIGKDRKKTAPERRRTTTVSGGKTVPSKEYKSRKDIGKQRQASTRVQQPEKARGSAALSPREAQRKAALERRKGKSGGSKKDLEKAASKMLSKKKTKQLIPITNQLVEQGILEQVRENIVEQRDRSCRELVIDC